MRLALSQLKKLQVQTKSGAFLGKVKNIILETEGQTVLQYEVGNYFGKKYLISREQIISIDDKKIVVDDNTVGAYCNTPVQLKSKKISAEPEGVMMRE